MIELQKIDSHERFSPNDEVTIGKGVVVYEIIAAYSDGTVMLREADTEKRRQRTVNTAKTQLNDVYLTPATHAKRDAAEAEKRAELAEKWIRNTINGLRDEAKRAQTRFESYIERGFMTHEHAVGALAEWTAAREVIEQLDADLELPELAEEATWIAVEIIASKRVHYGPRSSSDIIHDAIYRMVRTHWTKLLTTAISVRLSAEKHAARHLV